MMMATVHAIAAALLFFGAVVHGLENGVARTPPLVRARSYSAWTTAPRSYSWTTLCYQDCTPLHCDVLLWLYAGVAVVAALPLQHGLHQRS